MTHVTRLLILPTASYGAPMIDTELLKSLGWSDELIRTAGEVAQTVEAGAFEPGSVPGSEVDLQSVAPSTEVASGADVSGPPVAQVTLLIR